MKKTMNIFRILFSSIGIIIAALLLFQLGVAAKQKTVPQAFGYSMTKILSESMTESGFDVDNVVLSKKVAVSELGRGDIVSYYVHSDWTPVLEGEDRTDMKVVFHEIIEVKVLGGQTYFVTKGSSNASRDRYLVPYEAVAGKYVVMDDGTKLALNIVFGGNNAALWAAAIMLGVLLVVKTQGKANDKTKGKASKRTKQEHTDEVSYAV